MIEAENEELKERVKETNDNSDAILEVVELKQKIEDLETAKESMDQIISEKEAVIMDCNVYIENITGQLNQHPRTAIAMVEDGESHDYVEFYDKIVADL